MFCFILIVACYSYVVDNKILSTQKSYYADYISLPDEAKSYGIDINNADFDNAICWFWVENKDEIFDPTIGCSEIVECNPGTRS